MRQKRVLVTGANGYLGSHVVRTLIDLGSDVIATGRSVNAIDKRAHLVECDLFELGTGAFSKLGYPEVCIHMAWENGFDHNNFSHIKSLYKHCDFLNNMISAGLQHLVGIGSMHEIGYHEGAVSDNTPANPKNYYGVAKNSLRQILEIQTQEKNCVFQWLRCFYIYGDNERGSSIFSKIAIAAGSGEKSLPFTQGRNRYDFIHVDDLALEIALVSLQADTCGTINCCTGIPVSLKNQVESFIEENKFEIKLEYGAFPDREYDSPEIYGDTRHIKSILQGFLPVLRNKVEYERAVRLLQKIRRSK